MRYVDDTFVIQQEGHKQTFLEHINKMDRAIKFMVEGNQENGTIPFLDTLVKSEAENNLSITVYRKPMHIDKYLQWDICHHNLVAKYSVISTLIHRARTVCTKPDLLNKETQHLRKVLTKFKYPKWALDKVERKFTNRIQENSNVGNIQGELNEEFSDNPSSNTVGRGPTKDKYNKGNIVIPYMQRLEESIKKICREYGIHTHFKGNRTIKEMLVKPKRQGSFRQRGWGHLLASVWQAYI